MSKIDPEMIDEVQGEPVTAENTNANLLAEIGDDLAGWVVASLPYMRADGFRDMNTALECVYCDDTGRAGLTVTGSGSSGATEWTAANSLQDAFRRFVSDNLSP